MVLSNRGIALATAALHEAAMNRAARAEAQPAAPALATPPASPRRRRTGNTPRRPLAAKG